MASLAPGGPHFGLELSPLLWPVAFEPPLKVGVLATVAEKAVSALPPLAA